MRQSLLNSFVCCPIDRSFPLTIENATWNGDDLESGKLRCPKCDSAYPVESGIPNFLPEDLRQGQGAIAKQRELQARDADALVYDTFVPGYQTEIEIGALVQALDVGPGDIAVDLGAGTGRLTLELARRGATVLALDISPRSLAVN